MDNVLLYFSLKYDGNWMSIYNALDEKEKIESKDLVKVTETIPNNFISIINPLYPSSLKQISEPSFVLYFKGSISLLHNFHQTIAFIGGGVSDSYNKKTIIKIVEELINESRILLLSDETPMQALILDCIIKNKGKVIITTSKPLQEYLIKSSFLKKDVDQSDYLILSENENSSMFNEKNFIAQDGVNLKIVSGLVKAIIVLEDQNEKLITHFLDTIKEDNKSIFAIPQPVAKNDSISNKLLKQNAKLIENGLDILNKI